MGRYFLRAFAALGALAVGTGLVQAKDRVIYSKTPEHAEVKISPYPCGANAKVYGYTRHDELFHDFSGELRLTVSDPFWRGPRYGLELYSKDGSKKFSGRMCRTSSIIINDSHQDSEAISISGKNIDLLRMAKDGFYAGRIRNVPSLGKIGEK